jgi:hypothetical protein
MDRLERAAGGSGARLVNRRAVPAGVTDGGRLESGCPGRPKGAPRKACAAGVKRMQGPLVTFS